MYERDCPQVARSVTCVIIRVDALDIPERFRNKRVNYLIDLSYTNHVSAD